MATLEQLKTHIDKAKEQAKDKNGADYRDKHKKLKRLQRKSSKIIATANRLEESKKPKKERKAAS
ncbi:MAG: hypothetical protein G3M78_15085 [Candidatus Nitrohelix vancouverensis]|uniref:Uncharacterized protein n=1 Tax=Candidatus Nitrohelix vancouverensis TaxID=2705534 RepID=A0A7T0C4W0_9BACT|nr:MAG: hypothetical protein G3M78_15085 [Candidatus Nitrohelix vancouverensis]